jgi:F0F1-type ATP synthase assembly protein I
LIKEIQNTLKTSLSSAGQGFSDATGNINNILGNASGGAVDKIRDKMSGLNEQFKESTKTIDAMFDALKEAKSVEEIEQLFDAITGKIGNIKNLADAMNKMEGEAKKAKLSFDLLQGVMQSIGELGTVIEAIMSSNWIGLIIMLIGKLADLFGSLSSKAAAAKNILTFLVDTIADVIGTLGPYLDMIFEPLLETFAALGRVIGSLLNLIIPIVGMITKLVSSFDILTPILNTVAIFLAILADALGSIWNTIAEIIEKATLGIVDLDRMQTNNYKRMMESIEVQQDYNKYQNNSTSYSVAGDMYININIDQSHSFVNGDLMKLAATLRDEIRLAEKAGY